MSNFSSVSCYFYTNVKFEYGLYSSNFTAYAICALFAHEFAMFERAKDKSFYILFLFLIFLLLIGSAIQIAIYFTLLFRNDINTKYNSFEEDMKKEILDDEIRGKLKQFLDREL